MSAEGASTGITLCAPKLIVRDGERITIRDASQKTLVVAEKVSDTAPTCMLGPEGADHGETAAVIQISRHLDEGTTIEATVLGIDDRTVLLDLAYEFRGVRHGSEADSGGVRVEYVKGRAIECVELGTVAEFQLKELTVLARVSRSED